MANEILPRTLWHETEDGRETVDQSALIELRSPIVVLGEPGMGKTELLNWLGEQPGFAFCTARRLINVRPTPERLLGSADVLVIDALDELSARSDGDAVDLVLQRLGDAGYPRFVLSCRVADWRSATNFSAIKEQYAEGDPTVLHLEPLTEDDIRQLLECRLVGGSITSEAVVAHFRRHHLEGLLNNPQTLDMIARVARSGKLPETKSDLFAEAVSLLRQEHQDGRADDQVGGQAVLNAAGSAFATLILTGSEAIVSGADVGLDGEIPVSEIAELPLASHLPAALRSRLFVANRAANRFSYGHRRIGEYLGSRWLANIADTGLKRRRVLSLFHTDGVVPASLRGLHAWLANHSTDLAADVISTDPMGVLEYGDPATFTISQLRQLLEALKELSADDPYFWDWQQLSSHAFARPELLDDVRSVLVDPSAEFRLRLLLLDAIVGEPVAAGLRPELEAMVQESKLTYALRKTAAEALRPREGIDWVAIVETFLRSDEDENIRLALEIVHLVGPQRFGDALIVDLVLARATGRSGTSGLLTMLGHAIPEDRSGPILDLLVGRITAANNTRRGVPYDLAYLIHRLVAKHLALGETDPRQLLAWLAMVGREAGYHRELHGEIAEIIQNDPALRRACQRLVLLDDSGSKSVWQRMQRLMRQSAGFAPTVQDVVELLAALEELGFDDSQWRDVLLLIPHSNEEGAEARQAAKRLVANRSDMLRWIDNLTTPNVPKWQVGQARKERKQRARQAMQRHEHRLFYAENVDDLRRGELNAVASPAQAYVGHFHDLNNDLPPRDRLVDWLGPDLAVAAFEGFEAFLQSGTPPSASAIAENYADSKAWVASAVIIAALEERIEAGSGFDGVTDDRLVAGFYDHHRLNPEAPERLERLNVEIYAELRRRGLVESAYQGWIKPQFAAERDHIDQLHQYMTDDSVAAAAVENALKWLQLFPDMGEAPEIELIERVLTSPRSSELTELCGLRLSSELSLARCKTWNAAAFFVDFDAHRAHLEQFAASGPGWLWSIRKFMPRRRGRPAAVALSAEQLKWLFSTFRALFPDTDHPLGATSGNTNAWDASEFLWSIAFQLGERTSEDAQAALDELIGERQDGYTRQLCALGSEQRRKRAEQNYRPPTLPELRAIADAQPPRSVSDLQATVLELLDQVQKRLIADPADPWRGFYNDNHAPFDEERCRDHLLTMLGVRPEGIDLSPEGHLADDNRADIIAGLNGLRLPIEIKGQWHPELWRSADTQLDRLYSTDYQADRRGIYLVLWFGNQVDKNKMPRSKGHGHHRPTCPVVLRNGIAEQSQAAREGRVKIVVLDISR